MDTVRRFLNEDPDSRMKIDLHAEDSWSSEGSSIATCPRCKGKGNTPERLRTPAEEHPHKSRPFATCSDGDRRDR